MARSDCARLGGDAEHHSPEYEMRRYVLNARNQVGRRNTLAKVSGGVNDDSRDFGGVWRSSMPSNGRVIVLIPRSSPCISWME